MVLGESEWAAWGMVWKGWVVLCLCESGLYVLMAGPGICIFIMVDGFLHILGAPSVQSCCTLSIPAS